MTKGQFRLKRMVDLIVTFPLALISVPLIILLTICCTIDTRQWGLFKQLRIGRYGRPFQLFKLRSLSGVDHEDIHNMRQNSSKYGRWLRKSKLDEIPQLWQVLGGKMSLVGPRPDIPGYADELEGEDRIILELKPGVTGPASIKYAEEDDLLLNQDMPKRYNDQVIWPDKVKMNKSYYENWSLWSDFRYLWQTVIHT